MHRLEKIFFIFHCGLLCGLQFVPNMQLSSQKSPPAVFMRICARPVLSIYSWTSWCRCQFCISAQPVYFESDWFRRMWLCMGSILTELGCYYRPRSVFNWILQQTLYNWSFGSKQSLAGGQLIATDNEKQQKSWPACGWFLPIWLIFQRIKSDSPAP
jgi:hypothetical protein